MVDSQEAAVGFARIVLRGEVPVMVGPGDEIAAGRGHLRASHADREQTIGTLKAAYVAGMLAKDEFDLRVGQTLTSRTYAELTALTADLPAGLAAIQPPKPARARGGQPVLRPGQIIVGATVLYAVVWGFLLSPAGDNQYAVSIFVLGSLAYLGILAIAVAVALENRQARRSGRQLPRGQAPGAGGQGSRRLPSAGPDRQLPQTGHGDQHAAEAAPIRRPPPPRLPGWRLQATRDTSRIRHSAVPRQPLTPRPVS
jgi:hypothetical protein